MVKEKFAEPSKSLKILWSWLQNIILEPNLFFRKLFVNLTQKVMSTSKTEMKSKYETKFIYAPVNKTGIKNVFCGYSRYTTVYYLNQQNQRKVYIIFKKTKKLQHWELWVCLNALYWKDYIDLLLLWMFIWIPRNKVDVFTVLYSYNTLFYSTLSMPGISRKHPRD